MTMDRRRPKPAAYHLMSSHEKQVYSRQQVREAAVVCPGGCGMQLMPADLLSHIEQRCAGPGDPGPSAKWLCFREALALGVARDTLSRWARPNFEGVIRVRSRGSRGDRQYLARDLQIELALRKAGRRR